MQTGATSVTGTTVIGIAWNEEARQGWENTLESRTRNESERAAGEHFLKLAN